MSIHKRDLKNQTGANGPRPILFCAVCGSENSANSGDYWDWPDDHEFKCCGKPMSLCIKRTVYEEVLI